MVNWVMRHFPQMPLGLFFSKGRSKDERLRKLLGLLFKETALGQSSRQYYPNTIGKKWQ